MMVAFLLLLPAAQCPDFLIAGVIMDMFFHPAYQVPVCIIAPVLSRVPVLRQLAVQFCRYRAAAVIVVMAVTFFLPADKPYFVTAVAVLVLFNPAYGVFFQRNRREDQRICSDEDDYCRQ